MGWGGVWVGQQSGRWLGVCRIYYWQQALHLAQCHRNALIPAAARPLQGL